MNQTHTDAFAEILESSLESFKAQSWEWDNVPSFGSLVLTEHGTQRIIGVVTSIQTGSFDPMRYPFPYKKTEEDLKRDHPQIFEFLKTIFTVHVLGVEEAGTLSYRIPQTPCKIHTFVRLCPQELHEAFFKTSQDYLNILFAAQGTLSSIDELFVAMMHNLAEKKIVDEPLLEAFATRFSLLSGNDYRRLKHIVGRLQKLVERPC
jgi:hypothetical protein